MFNNGFVTGLLWSAGVGVVLAVVACFWLLLVLHYTCQKITKGSLYRGAGLSLLGYTYYIIAGCFGRGCLLYRFVGVTLHMPQDNKRLALSWGEPFFVVVHLLYNRRFRGLSWPSPLALSSCWCCITSVEGCKQPSPSVVSLFFINRKTFALKCPFSISL